MFTAASVSISLSFSVPAPTLGRGQNIFPSRPTETLAMPTLRIFTITVLFRRSNEAHNCVWYTEKNALRE